MRNIKAIFVFLSALEGEKWELNHVYNIDFIGKIQNVF